MILHGPVSSCPTTWHFFQKFSIPNGILQGRTWIADRFFERGENALAAGGIEDLRDLSCAYFDYWTRDSIRIESLDQHQ